MDIKLESLKRGFFKHTVKPGLIKQSNLESYLIHCRSRHKLIKEISYVLTTKEEERYKIEYKIAYNSCSIDSWQFKVVLSNNKKISKLSELLIIDISILNNPKAREVLFNKYPWLKSDLIDRLNNYE